MDSSATIQANCLQVYLMRADFDRRRELSAGNYDPPLTLLFEIVNDFVARYRSAARSPSARFLTPTQTLWSLRYLRDDETELPEDPALRRGAGASHYGFRLSGLNTAVWNRTWNLPPGYRPHGWEWLLLDAEALLPEVGPTIMVAYSALETFISWALDQLAIRKGLPPELWDWINDRGRQHEKEPSIAERFDMLLKVLAGKSLKEENRLWEQFQNIRTIRNSFSHEGKLMLGGAEVTAEQTFELIGHAKAIIEWVENLLPQELRRPAPVPAEWQTILAL